MNKELLVFAVMASLVTPLCADISLNVPLDGEQAQYTSTFELINGSGGDAKDTFAWSSVPDIAVGDASVNWSYTLSAPTGGYYQYIPPAGAADSGYTDYGISFSFIWQTDNYFSGPPVTALNFAITFNEASENFSELTKSGSGRMIRLASGSGGTLQFAGTLGSGFTPEEVYTFESVTFSVTLFELLSQNPALTNFTGTNGSGTLVGSASTASQFEAPVQPDPGEFFTYVAPAIPEPAHLALAGGLIALLVGAATRRYRLHR